MHHASVVLHHGRCLIFTGEGGVGKSTRAARLMLAGATLIADDVVMMESGRVIAPPRIAGILAIRERGLLMLPYTHAESSIVTETISLVAGHTDALTNQEWEALCALGKLLPTDWMAEV